MATIYTVKPEHLIRNAERIERDAEQSLNAWIMVGQGDRYGDALRTARALRNAAAERNITVRREILRNSGFTVLMPKHASRAK